MTALLKVKMKQRFFLIFKSLNRLYEQAMSWWGQTRNVCVGGALTYAQSDVGKQDIIYELERDK